MQAIDPDYPVDEEKYKSDLNQADYVIYTWLPHDFLASYVQINAETIVNIEGGGYGVNVAKLKSREKRK